MKAKTILNSLTKQCSVPSTTSLAMLADVGYEPSNLSSQQLADFIKIEIPKWAKVIREAGITPE